MARLETTSEDFLKVASPLPPPPLMTPPAAAALQAAPPPPPGSPASVAPVAPLWDVILAGDVFYEGPLAAAAAAFFEAQAALGAVVYAGDPGRTYGPSKHPRPAAAAAVSAAAGPAAAVVVAWEAVWEADLPTDVEVESRGHLRTVVYRIGVKAAPAAAVTDDDDDDATGPPVVPS